MGKPNLKYVIILTILAVLLTWLSYWPLIPQVCRYYYMVIPEYLIYIPIPNNDIGLVYSAVVVETSYVFMAIGLAVMVLLGCNIYELLTYDYTTEEIVEKLVAGEKVWDD